MAKDDKVDEKICESERENAHKAYKRTRELVISNEKTAPVLRQLLKDSGVVWGYTNYENYTPPIVAIYSADKEKPREEGTSNGNSRETHVVAGTHATMTVKRSYETRSASSGSSNQPFQKQPQPQLSNGDRKRKYKNKVSDIAKSSERMEIFLVDEVGTEEVPNFTYIPHNIAYQNVSPCESGSDF